MRLYPTVQELMEEGNPWREFDFEISDRSIQYGSKAGKYHYPAVTWTNQIGAPRGMKLEIKRLDTGRIKKADGLFLSFGQNHVHDYEPLLVPIKDAIDFTNLNVHVVWEKGKIWLKEPTADTVVPVHQVLFRVEDKLLRRTAWLMDTVQVGDFVKCKGTRSGDWNKVESISDTKKVVYGPKYEKPEEGYMRYASSDNGIEKVMKIVRDGEEIVYPG